MTSWRPTQTENQPLFEALAEIAREERRRARLWQRRAGISEPVKTGFRPGAELDPELNQAVARLWKLSCEDQDLQRLYSMVGRGVAALTEEDFKRLMGFPDAVVRKATKWLVLGRGLKESIEKSFLRREVAPQVVTEEEPS